MEDQFYRIDPTVLCSDDHNEQYFSASLNGMDDLYDQYLFDQQQQQQPVVVVDHGSCSNHDDHNQILLGSSSSSLHGNNPNNDDDDEKEIMFDDMIIKTKITSHPRYPSLVSAYFECQKVGAPPELVAVLDHEVVLEEQNHTTTATTTTGHHNYCFTASTTDDQIGADDPELDQFMELYCIYLQRYKDELSKPLDEATSFMIQIEKQLTTLFSDTQSTTNTTATSANYPSDETTGSSEEQSCSFDAVEAPSLESQKAAATTSSNAAVPAHAEYGDRALKEMLLHKYSGYLSTLRKEFTKKRKKGKLPRDARMTLLNWWKSHPRWPYPTEEEKMQLVEVTGLDPKQITNWFINQRKRHWKPSEDQRIALMDGITSDT